MFIWSVAVTYVTVYIQADTMRQMQCAYLLLVVAGVEVASAKTQTTKSADVFPQSAGPAALPCQFVVGK